MKVSGDHLWLLVVSDDQWWYVVVSYRQWWSVVVSGGHLYDVPCLHVLYNVYWKLILFIFRIKTGRFYILCLCI